MNNETKHLVDDALTGAVFSQYRPILDSQTETDRSNPYNTNRNMTAP